MTDGDMQAATIRREEWGFDSFAIEVEARQMRRYPGPSFENERLTLDLWRCPRCCAVVDEVDGHIDWHEKLGA